MTPMVTQMDLYIGYLSLAYKEQTSHPEQGLLSTKKRAQVSNGPPTTESAKHLQVDSTQALLRSAPCHPNLLKSETGQARITWPNLGFDSGSSICQRTLSPFKPLVTQANTMPEARVAFDCG